MRLTDRKVELLIYANDGSNTQVVDLSGLDFSFTVEASLPEKKNKKNKTNPIKAQITIYKTNKDTISKLSASDTATRIRYGYGDEMFDLFSGTNINIVPNRVAPDQILNIYAAHAWEAYKESWFSRSYKSGTLLKTIINDIAKSFGLPVVNRFARTDTIALGASYDGESKDIFDDLAIEYDFTWEISDNTITVIDTLDPPLVNRTRVAVLGPSLISGPIVEESLENENKKNEKVVRRVRATSVLLPYLYPGVPVQFESESVTRSFSGIQTTKLQAFDPGAIFICDSVIHRGSSMPTQSITEIVTKEEKV